MWVGRRGVLGCRGALCRVDGRSGSRLPPEEVAVALFSEGRQKGVGSGRGRNDTLRNNTPSSPQSYLRDDFQLEYKLTYIWLEVEMTVSSTGYQLYI